MCKSLAKSKNLVIITAFVRLLINPPITGTTKNANLEYLYFLQTATDVLYNGYEFIVYEEKKIETKNTHGTGCTLSSAIAALLAQNYSLEEAVQQAKSYLTGAIKAAALHSPGHGYGY